MPYLIYSPAAVEARITSRTMRAKLMREHISWAATDFAQQQGCSGALPRDAIAVAGHYPRIDTGDVVVGDQEHHAIAGRAALLVWETHEGAMPS